MVMQQATLIGYRITEVNKHLIPANHKATRTPSHNLVIQTQERVFQSCLLPLTISSFIPLFLWLWIRNKQLRVRNYTYKDPKIDINNQIPIIPP